MTDNNEPMETNEQQELDPMDEQHKNQSSHSRQVWKGIGIAALLHLLLFIFPLAFAAIGLVQIIYILPAVIYWRKNTGLMQGLLIAAGITFLLNAACFGLVFGS